MFKNENELRTIWSRPDTRKALLEGLSEKGYDAEQLTVISRLINAEKSDLYDVLASEVLNVKKSVIKIAQNILKFEQAISKY